jgi:peptidoglycan/LPS O-acetylase OafA/YrhL
MVLGLDFHVQATEVLQRQDWLGQFLQFNASIIGLFRYSLIGVYITHTRELSYNPVLWTMSIEMIGSMLVFLLCYLWSRLKNPHWVCAALIIWLTALGSFYALFFAGTLLGYFRQQGYLKNLIDSKRYQLWASCILIAIVGILIVTKGMHKPIVLTLPLAMLLVFCFYTQGHLKAFFSNKFSHFLGEISFPLYLVHFQVLISLMSWLVIKDYAVKGSIDQVAFIGFACVTVLVSVFVAWCFRLIERQVLKRADALVLPILI